MIFSDLPSPAEALTDRTSGWQGFAQVGNQCPPSDRVRGQAFRDRPLIRLERRRRGDLLGDFFGLGALRLGAFRLGALGPARRGADRFVVYLGWDCCCVAALAGFAGALSTAMQAGGRSLSFKPADEPPNSGIFTLRIEAVNQWSSDLSHPSPPGTGGCARQSGESAGHFRRTWMWSS